MAKFSPKFQWAKVWGIEKSTPMQKGHGRFDEASDAWKSGQILTECKRDGCHNVVHFNLFFDGTNNIKDSNPQGEDAGHVPVKLYDLANDSQSQTNIVRLWQACRHGLFDTKRKHYSYKAYIQGVGTPAASATPAAAVSYKAYIQGVGTPFPEVGEPVFHTLGKAFSYGLGRRAAWGYTRLLNALSQYVGTGLLLDNKCALQVSRALIGEKSGQLMTERESDAAMLASKQSTLFLTHHNLRNDKRISSIYINVFGFSRGSSTARVFVNLLLQKWAPGGKIGGAKNGIPYKVHFVGLFDTVTSVGAPAGFELATGWETFDGHFGNATGHDLTIPADSLYRCVHFVAAHEQRANFPIDLIRKGASEYANNCVEVVYPGVHSDIGGGYSPNDQGKAMKSISQKIGQITLHDMYIEALYAGVPLQFEHEMDGKVRASFRVDPATVQAFNAWRQSGWGKKGMKPDDCKTVESAIRYAISQQLAWRALRAQVHSADYIAQQPFFARAPEDKMTAYVLARKVAQLRKQREAKLTADALSKSPAASSGYLALLPEHVRELVRENVRRAEAARKLKDKELEALRRSLQDQALLEEAAGAGKKGKSRPGEEAIDLLTNDQTDLLESAEEFRLLMGYLFPAEAESVWGCTWITDVMMPLAGTAASGASRFLSVWRDTPPKRSASHGLTPSYYGQAPSRLLLVQSVPGAKQVASLFTDNPQNDILVRPAAQIEQFVRDCTNADMRQLMKNSPALCNLYDDYCMTAAPGSVCRLTVK